MGQEENFGKGQEVLDQFTTSVPDETKDYLSNIKTRISDATHLRPARIFFGLGESRPYEFEQNIPLALTRTKDNLKFFYPNYLFLSVVVFLLTLLVSTGALLAIGFLGLAWASVIRPASRGTLQVRGYPISQSRATLAMSVLSIFVLKHLLSKVFWWAFSTSAFFVATHALFRNAAVQMDDEDRVEMYGNLSYDAMGKNDTFIL